MQTLTFCNAKITSTRTAVSQFKGQFNGAMERYTRVRFAGNLTDCHNAHVAKVSIPVAMEELSRQGQKASTHISLR